MPFRRVGWKISATADAASPPKVCCWARVGNSALSRAPIPRRLSQHACGRYVRLVRYLVLGDRGLFLCRVVCACRTSSTLAQAHERSADASSRYCVEWFPGVCQVRCSSRADGAHLAGRSRKPRSRRSCRQGGAELCPLWTTAPTRGSPRTESSRRQA